MGSPIAETHGPAEIGVFVNVFLYGVMVCQVWSYYSTYQKDPLWLKLYVGVLMFADSLNTLFSCWWIFDLTIMQFGNLAKFAVANWTLGADPAMGGIIAFYCQAFFAWRLKVLTGNKWIAGAVFFFGFCVMIGGLAIAIALGIQPELDEIASLAPVVYVWLVPGVAADLIITVAMTYYLRRKRTNFSKTSDVLNRIIRLTVQSCLLTTLCSLGDLASYLATDKGYHIGFSLPIPKLYSNSVLSSLNSRPRANNIRGWEDATQGPGGLSYSEPDDEERGIGFSGSRRTGSTSNKGDVISLQATGRSTAVTGNPGATTVFVDVETHVTDDLTKTRNEAWSTLEDDDSQRDSK